MGDAVSDAAAISFAVALYRALANDKPLAAAVDLGRNQIDLAQLAEADYPQLQADRVDPTQVRARNWDLPDAESQTATGQTINTGGGSNIDGDVHVGGNMAGRDYIGEQHIHYHGEASRANRGIHLGAQFATPRGLFGLFHVNEHFFGRDDELATLHNLLQSEPNVSICPTITGMGGLGKTQLAAHYARGHVADYPDGIFWITAANLNAIRPQLADFCVALSLPVADPQRSGDLTEQKISAFKAYLDGHPQALLILDNVEEPAHLRTRQIGVGFTALTLGGKVLVTTRRRKLPSDRFAELPLERLLPSPARQILTTARPDLATDTDLDRLCAQFGYLPLMLNLAAAALKKRGGAIAGYLQKLQERGIDTLHDRARVSLEDYHQTLTAVLQEQWAMLTSDDAQLLLRVAGQLPEAEVIPTARLGLLAGLQDVDEWECPLSLALEALDGASLIEQVDGATVRLHPLVHEFAFSLSDSWERYDFCHECARNLTVSFDDLAVLESNCRIRGVASVIVDILTARYFLSVPLITTPHPRPIPNQPDFTDLNLYILLRILRREMHNLQNTTASEYSNHFLQQYLYRSWTYHKEKLTKQVAALLVSRFKSYFRPVWASRKESFTLEQTLVGHKRDVNALAILDGQRIISASKDHTLKVWNLHTGMVEQTMIGHEDSVTAVVVLDAQHVVSASQDGSLKVWNLQTGTVEQTLEDRNVMVNTIAVLSNNRIISGSSHDTLKLWNLQTNEVEQILIGYDDAVHEWSKEELKEYEIQQISQDHFGVNAVVRLDENRIVYASGDGTLKIWNLQTGKLEQTLQGHEGEVTSVAILDNERIVSASDDHSLIVWNWQTGKIMQILRGHKSGVNSVTVLDRDHIVSACGDETLKVWDLRIGKVEYTLTGHARGINAVSVLDDKRLLSASDDETLKLWNLATDIVEQHQFGHEFSIYDLLVVDENDVVSASADGKFKIWDLSTGEIKQTINYMEDFNATVKLDDQHIVSSSDEGTLKIWNLQTGEAEQIFTLYAHNIRVMAVLGLERVVFSSNDFVLNIWNTRTNVIERTLSGHMGSINAVAELTENRIVSTSIDNTIIVWNLQTDTIEQTLRGHHYAVNAVAKLDENRIVSASDDSTLIIWNLQTGTIEQTLSGHDYAVNAVAKLDENHIVSASSDGTLIVWNLYTGEIEQTLINDKIGVNSANDLAVVDIQHIIVSNYDGDMLLLWNLQTGEIEQTFPCRQYDNGIDAITVFDSQHVISRSSTALTIWNLQTGQIKQTFPKQPKHFGTINEIAVVDKERIVSASNDCTIKIWNLRTGAVEQTLVGHGNMVNAVALLEGGRVVSASVDGEMNIWNLQTGEIEDVIAGHKDYITDVIVLNSQHIISASHDHAVKVWNLVTRSVETFIGHESYVNAVAALDHERIVSASDDHTLKVWHLPTGMVERTFTGHDSGVIDIAVLDSQRIILASADRSLKVWDLTIGKEIASIGLDDVPLSIAMIKQGSCILIVAGDRAGSLYCLELVEPVGE